MKVLFVTIISLLVWSCNRTPNQSSGSPSLEAVPTPGASANGSETLKVPERPTSPTFDTRDELRARLLQNPELMDAAGFYVRFAKVPGAFEDKELVGLVRERFFAQRRTGLGYGETATILRTAKDQKIGPSLLEDIKKLNAFDFTGLDQWQIGNLLPQNRKYLWLNTLIDIGEPTSMIGMWQHFEEGGAQTQRTIARAVSNSGDLAQANACISHMESAKDEAVRQDLQYAASCIVTNALSKPDNTQALELAKELQKAGHARDFLIEKLEKIEKSAE